MKFSKFHGSGNDFIIIDDLEKTFPCNDTALIQRLCHRQFGIGADGLILAQHSAVADYKMKIFNSDGLEALMCGNGLRSLVLYLSLKTHQNAFLIESLKGIHTCHREGKYISTSLSLPVIRDLSKELEGEGSVHVIDTGVPHVVLFVRDLDEGDFLARSQKIRFDKTFDPEGVNVNMACIGATGEISIRTYERGVEDETLACGTGAAAVAVAARCIYGMKSPIQIRVKSQEELLCYLEETGGEISKISLRGRAQYVFDGNVDVS